MTDIASLINTVPQLYDDTVAIKLVEVAKKYNTPEVSSPFNRIRKYLSLIENQGEPIARVPEYTKPGGPNSYHCSKGESDHLLIPQVIVRLGGEADFCSCHGVDPRFLPWSALASR